MHAVTPRTARSSFSRGMLFALAALVMSLAAPAAEPVPAPGRMIVVGFLGGNIPGNDSLRREASLARRLRETYPMQVQSTLYANHAGAKALAGILKTLDTNGDGHLSPQEKQAARIVIYGHSWGASQTVTLASRLNRLQIPVLLTIQVDSVQKLHQQDGRIPPNVREAANFYQSEGWLRGRNPIVAANPRLTTILGNYPYSYHEHPVSCAGFPWYARMFMHAHIEIENDPVVWERLEALIRQKIQENGTPGSTPETASLASGR